MQTSKVGAAVSLPCNMPSRHWGEAEVECIWNLMAHGDAREGKWRGNWRMEWVASTLHITSERGVSSITTADAHTSSASSRLNWRPRWFKWTRPFRRKKNLVSARVPSRFKHTIQLYSYLTLVLEGVGWSTPCPGNFTHGKETQYPSYRRLVGATVLMHNVGFCDFGVAIHLQQRLQHVIFHSPPICHHHQTVWLTSFLQCELSHAVWVPFVGETAGHTQRTWMASCPDAASCDRQNLSGTCKHCVMWLWYLQTLCDVTLVPANIVWHDSGTCKCCVTWLWYLQMLCDMTQVPENVVWHDSGTCKCCVTWLWYLQILCDMNLVPANVVWRDSGTCKCCVTWLWYLQMLCDMTLVPANIVWHDSGTCKYCVTWLWYLHTLCDVTLVPAKLCDVILQQLQTDYVRH